MGKFNYSNFKKGYVEENKKDPNIPTLFVENDNKVIVMMADINTFAIIKEILSMHFDGVGWGLKAIGGDDGT